MKVLNLYSGVGGNRRLWEEVQVTAVELDPEIAEIYQDFYPNDKVIVGDAHEFLLENYKNYDFIWSSPPCPTHSDIRRCGVQKGQYEALYPDMKLYEEIILLQNFAPTKMKWVIENVRSYYEPLIKPQKSGRHYYWSNFLIPNVKHLNKEHGDSVKKLQDIKGINLDKYKIRDKRKILRNMVDSKIAKTILESAITQDSMFEVA